MVKKQQTKKPKKGKEIESLDIKVEGKIFAKTVIVDDKEMTILDSLSVQKIIDIFRHDGTVLEACAFADISKSSHYDAIKQKAVFLDTLDGFYKDYETAIKNAKSFAKIYARKSLYKGIANDPNLALKLLEKRDKRYTIKKELTGKGGGPLISQLSKEDQAHIDTLLKRNKK